MLKMSAVRLPHASAAALRGKQVLLFLDYDGTLTPIVSDPAAAKLSDETRAVLQDLVKKSEKAEDALQLTFVSGRAVPKLQAFLGLTGNIICAGSHGFEIQGSTAAGAPVAYHIADEYLVTLQAAFRHLQSRLASVDGASVEDNKYSVTAHWRNVQEDRVGEVEAAVDEFIASPGACREDGSRLLIKRPGKRVFEIRPAVDWHKGRAVRRILEELLAAGGSGSGGADVAVVILGDDHTDEDMFAAAAELQAEASAHGRKVSCFPILVAQPVEDGTAPDGAAASASGADATSDTAARLALMPRETKATAYLQDPSDVRRFLEELRSSLA